MIPVSQRSRHLRWYYRNRERQLLKAREWHKKNPERSHANATRWKNQNQERVKELKRDFYKRNRSRLPANKTSSVVKRNYKHRKRAASSVSCLTKIKLLSQERFCRWCCRALTRTNREIDHIIPLSRGGLHIPDNLSACCRSCNASKGNKMVSDWLPTVGDYYTL